MNASKKILGLAAGVSAVAVIGAAVAQGVPPNPEIANPALAAGQQSSLETSMGETGVPAWEQQVQTAVIVPQPAAPEPVAVAPAPAPEPVAAAPAPAPEPVAAAPVPEPAPVQEVAQAPAPRADRN